MACQLCYSLVFNCGDDIVLDLGLSATTDYTILVKNNQTDLYYSYATISDGDGALTWPGEDQPEAVFVPFNGSYTATIQNEDGENQTFNVGYDEYTCAEFEFRSTTTVSPA